MSRTRAIRFSTSEERQIEEFLRQNPFLDFSSLARLAIMKFIEKPEIEIRPVRQAGKPKVGGTSKLPKDLV